MNPDFLTEVKTSGEFTVLAGHKKQIRCRVKVNPGSDDDQVVYFAPRLCGEDEFSFLDPVSQIRCGKTNYMFMCK